MDNQNRFFSVIIPTMWRSNKTIDTLINYEKSNFVKEIILIDNNPSQRPDLSKFKKIKYYTEGKNIFVNGAWNIGFALSNYRLIIANDDVIVNDIDRVLNLFTRVNYDIIGIDLSNQINGELYVSDINVFPKKGYGSFLYVKNYIYIPEQFKIWFGDNILFEKSRKKGILKNVSVNSELSTTVNYIRKSLGNDIIQNDIDNFEFFKQNEERFNIIIRTSGRPNFFRKCYNSVLKHYPSAKLHITIDDVNDLKYVQDIVKGMDYNYYLIDKKTITKITEKIPIIRQKFIYNYYFNVVKPFLNGWCMFLDDDDMMINKPSFFESDINKLNLFKVDLISNIVPSQMNFGKKPVLNDINTSCIIVHSSKLIDWLPHRGGDFDFINSLFNKSQVNWYDQIIVKSQEGGNYGKRNDTNMKTKFLINGFYLNLDKRIDRKEKMENELKKSSHNIFRFPAIDGTKIEAPIDFIGTIKNSESKQYATYLSHYEMIKFAKDNNWDNLLILEDDVTLCNDFDELLEFFLNTLPNDWKIAYLGFNEQPTTKLYKINEFIYKVENVLGCFGMIINHNFYDELLSIIEKYKTPIDEVIKSYVQGKFSCYAFLPFFLFVNDDFSDIWNKHRVIDRIKKYFKKELPQKLNFDFTINLEKTLIDKNIPIGYIQPEEKNINKVKKILNLEGNKNNVVNYDLINTQRKNPQVYQPNLNQKPKRENLPQNRNEIIQLKKDSLAKVTRDFFSKGKKYKG